MTNATIIALRDEELGLVAGGKAVKLPASAIRFLNMVEAGNRDILKGNGDIADILRGCQPPVSPNINNKPIFDRPKVNPN